MVEQEARYERNSDYIFRKVVDELVLVPIHQDIADMDCIYTMNSVAAFIWEQLDKPMTQADLQTAMLDEYAADPEVIAADLDDFLREMTAIGAVKRS